MVEHKSHAVALTRQATDAYSKSAYEVVETGEQYVGQDGAFQVSPQALDQIEARRVWR